MTTRWIQTYSGHKFDPIRPDPAMIDIRDIAHGLSLTCRYNGQCRDFYSVAEHSLIISYRVPPYLRLAALLHDASEAYISDVTSPVKASMAGYQRIEHALQAAIYRRYNCEPGNRDYQKWIKRADLRILVDEKAALFERDLEWRLPFRKLGIKIECLSPTEAEKRFLKRFEELTR